MRRSLLVPLCGALLLMACVSEPAKQPAHTLSTPAVQAYDFRSFVIEPVRTKGHRLDLEERFNTATQRALEAKGYSRQDGNGDMQVLYALGTKAQPGIELRPVMGSNGAVYTQTEMTNEQTAVLALRILDNRDQRLLFEAQISRQFSDPNFTQERFDQAVAKLLEEFPPRKR